MGEGRIMDSYMIGKYRLKDIQHVMAKMMNEIHKICVKYKIRYILDGGTMLGAVRHNGFIPWDDDFDIAMPRDDYDKFIKIANKELGPLYRFECMENTKEYPYNFGKVRAVNTLYVEKFTEKLNINHGIYIDVFPMDYVDYNNKKHLKYVQKMIGRFTMLKYSKLGLCKGLKYLPFKILPIKFYNKLLNRFMKYYINGKTKEMVQKLCHFGKNKPPISISLFSNTIKVKFDEYEFFIPKDYNDFLTGRYGDYMKLPPEEKQKPCHEIGEISL